MKLLWRLIYQAIHLLMIWEARTVSICTTGVTGHEKTNFTVVLTCTAELPPIIIFKLKKIPRGNFHQELLFVQIQQDGWMKMKCCIGLKMFGLNAQDFHFQHTLLTLWNDNLAKKTPNIAVIPRGLTSRLQPLDVSITSLLKQGKGFFCCYFICLIILFI